MRSPTQCSSQDTNRLRDLRPTLRKAERQRCVDDIVFNCAPYWASHRTSLKLWTRAYLGCALLYACNCSQLYFITKLPYKNCEYLSCCNQSLFCSWCSVKIYVVSLNHAVLQNSGTIVAQYKNDTVECLHRNARNACHYLRSSISVNSRSTFSRTCSALVNERCVVTCKFYEV